MNTAGVGTNIFNATIDVDAGSTFTVSQNIVGAQLAKRGGGVLNIGGANVLTNAEFYDAGTVNFLSTGSTSIGAFRSRSAVVNIGVGTVNTTNSFTSFGPDTNGTNGGPDKATLNIFGTGVVNAADQDFNFSDNGSLVNPGTEGTLTLSDNGQLNVKGTVYASKSPNTKAYLTQSGGTFTVGTAAVNRNFVMGQGTLASSQFNKTGGFTRVEGEMQIGNTGGNATFTQSGGTTEVNSWISVGRSGPSTFASLNMSGGTFTKTGSGGTMYAGEQNGAGTVNLSGGTMTIASSEFWLGNAGSSTGVLNQTAGAFTVNNWLGRSVATALRLARSTSAAVRLLKMVPAMRRLRSLAQTQTLVPSTRPVGR